MAARVLALAAACPVGAAVVGAAAFAVEPATGAVVAAGAVTDGGAGAASGAAVVATGIGDDTGAADETGAAVGVLVWAAGLTLLWCPAQPVASVTTSVTPATSVRDDLRITSALS